MKTLKTSAKRLLSILIITALSPLSAFAATAVIDGEYLLFSDDFESYAVDSYPVARPGGDSNGWTSIIRSEASPIRIINDGESNALQLSRSDSQTEAAGPRIEKKIKVNDNCAVRIKCRLKTGEQWFQIQMITAAEGVTVVNPVFSFNGADVLSHPPKGVLIRPDAYMALEAVIDFRKSCYTTYIDGVLCQKEVDFKPGTDISGGVTLRFGSSVNPGRAVCIDDVAITTDDETVAEAKLINIDALTADPKEPVVPRLKKSHPRIYFDSFDTMREKIESDGMSAAWYAKVKAAADTYLDVPPEAYSAPENILTNTSRRIMYKLYILAFVYGIERDDRYKERAVLEMVNAGDYPSWHPNNFLGVAEMTNGFSVAYDWMYNGMTEDERKTVLDIILGRGVYLAALGYEHISDDFFVTAKSNWNFVCNGGMMTAAIAIADERPALAEYLLDKAADSIPTALGPTFAPQGASPEGSGYWSYAAENLFHIIAMLDNAVKDGSALPKRFDFSRAQGLSATLDFPIAVQSTVGAFNYGDNVPGPGGWSAFPLAYWAAKKYNKPQYTWYQLNNLDLKGNHGTVWKIIQKIVFYDPSDLLIKDAEFPLDKAYSHDNGPNLVTLRSSWADSGEIYAGIQGGSNQGPHMDLSLGNFALDALGERWATMCPPGGYRWPGYFDTISQRWTYYCAKTEGQNCVVINPDEGPEQNVYAVGKTVAFDSNAKEAFGVLDLTQAYDKNVVSYKRGVRLFDGRSRVLLQDDIEAKEIIKSGWWFMHTDAKIEIADDGKSAMLIKNGKRVRAKIVSGHENARFQVMAAKPLPTSPNPEAQQSVDYGYKLAIDISGVSELRLAVMFVPLEEQQAPPAGETEITGVDDWRLFEAGESLNSAMGSSVALFVNSPYAYLKGGKRYLASSDGDSTPVVANGRALVPVRFISEAIGASVGWNKEAQTVTVAYSDKKISLAVNSDKMLVNGEDVNLEAPAQIFNSRLFIPLRAISDALNQDVFWDDSGLIIIGQESCDGEIKDKLVALLKYQLVVNGSEVAFFDFNQDACDVLVAPDRTQPSTVALRVFNAPDAAEVVHLSGATGSAAVFANGKKMTVNLLPDEFYYASSGKAIKSLVLTNADFKDMTGVVTWIPAAGGVFASQEGAYAVTGINDNDLKTGWSANGQSYVQYDFGEEVNVWGLSEANDSKNGTRKYTFSVEKSADGEKWEEVLPNTQTSGETDFPEIFELGNVTARYMRFVARGNNTNDWNIYYELRYYENEAQAAADKANWNDYFSQVRWDAMKVGSTMRLTVKGTCNDGAPADLTGSAFTYESDSPDVAAVTPDGILTVQKEGTANISVTVDYHGISEKAAVSVTAIK